MYLIFHQFMLQSYLATKCQGELPNPMQFRISNEKSKNKPFTHCGVIDFSNLSTNAFLPNWMMKRILVANNDEIRIEISALPIGSYARFRPMSIDFNNISEPTVVLEICLRQYPCLTIGDTIAIEYNNKIYEFEVEDLKPYNAVNITECDMSKKSSEDDAYVIDSKLVNSNKFFSFSGKGQRLDGKINKQNPNIDFMCGIPRGVPNYNYRPGSLNFYRRHGTTKENEINPTED